MKKSLGFTLGDAMATSKAEQENADVAALDAIAEGLMSSGPSAASAASCGSALAVPAGGDGAAHNEALACVLRCP